MQKKCLSAENFFEKTHGVLCRLAPSFKVFITNLVYYSIARVKKPHFFEIFIDFLQKSYKIEGVTKSKAKGF